MNTKYLRYLHIIALLSTGNKYTYHDLAKKFNVSNKSIKKDIVDLSLYYPITTILGRNGGITMINTQETSSISLTQKEKTLLVNILLSYEHCDYDDFYTLNTLLHKLIQKK